LTIAVDIVRALSVPITRIASTKVILPPIQGNRSKQFRRFPCAKVSSRFLSDKRPAPILQDSMPHVDALLLRLQKSCFTVVSVFVRIRLSDRIVRIGFVV
jgi:hypothetical protein